MYKESPVFTMYPTFTSLNSSRKSLPTNLEQDALRRTRVESIRSAWSASRNHTILPINAVPSLYTIMKKTECKALCVFMLCLLMFYIVIITLLQREITVNFTPFGTLQQNSIQTISLDKEIGIVSLAPVEAGTYFAVTRARFDVESQNFEADMVIETVVNGALEMDTVDGTFAGVAERIWEVEAAEVDDEFSLAFQTLFQNKATEVSIGYNKVEDTIDVDTASTRDFISMIGDGVLVSMEPGNTYISTVFNSDGDSFTSCFGTRSGEILAKGLDATDRDISSRAIFTPSSDGDFLFRMRGSNIQVVTEDLVSASIRIEEIQPTEIEVESDGSVSLESISLKIGASNLYEIELSAGIEYEFTVSSTLTIANELIEVRSLETDDSIFFLPKFLPGVSLTLTDKTNNNLLTRGSSQLAFTEETNGESNNKNRVEVDVSEEGDLNLVFSPAEDTTVLLDLLTLQPDFQAEQADEEIGEYDVVITSRQLVSVAPALALTDPNDPFSTCDIAGAEFIEKGCNAGVYLFCRQDVFPFQDLRQAPILALEAICVCMELTCTVPPADGVSSDVLQPIIAVLRLSVTLIAILMLCVETYVVAELVVFDDFRRRTIEQHSIYGMLLCYISFSLHAAHSYLDFSVVQVGNQFSKLSSAFEQSSGLTDPDFYDIDLFPELSEPAEFENGMLPFMNQEAIDVFDTISLDTLTATGRGLFFMRYLMMMVALLLLLDGWTHRMTLSPGKTFFRREQEINKEWIRMVYFRVLQGVGMSALFAFPMRVVFQDGEGYVNYLFFVATFLCFVSAIVLLRNRADVMRIISPHGVSSVETAKSASNLELNRLELLIRETTIGVFFSVVLMGISFLYIGVKASSIAEFSFQKTNKVYEMFDTYSRFGELFLTITAYRFLHLNHNELKSSYIKAFSPKDAGSVSEEVSNTRDSATMQGKLVTHLHQKADLQKPSGASALHVSVGLGYPFFANRQFIETSVARQSSVTFERTDATNLVNAQSAFRSGASLYEHPIVRKYVPDSAVDDII